MIHPQSWGWIWLGGWRRVSANYEARPWEKLEAMLLPMVSAMPSERVLAKVLLWA